MGKRREEYKQASSTTLQLDGLLHSALTGDSSAAGDGGGGSALSLAQQQAATTTVPLLPW